MTSPSRLRALTPFLAGALVPALLALVLMGLELGGLLAVMWVVLVMTAGLAATAPRGEKPVSWDPGGRLR